MTDKPTLIPGEATASITWARPGAPTQAQTHSSPVNNQQPQGVAHVNGPFVPSIKHPLHDAVMRGTGSDSIQSAMPTYGPTGSGPEAAVHVQVEQPAKVFSLGVELTEADRNADFYSVQLPSDFLFYPFKKLSVKLVTGRQQAKFARAAKEVNLRYAVEAITSCLGDGIDCMDLTIPDFYFLMYWLKIASYTKFNFTHVAECYNPAHVRAHNPRTKKVDERLKNIPLERIHIINNTNIKQTNYVPKHLDLSAVMKTGLRLTPAKMRDSVEFGETFNPEDEDFSEAEYLVDIAAYIDPIQNNVPERLTLKQRMDLAASLPGDVLEEIKTFKEDMLSYGVEETIQVKCGCGAEIKTKVSISAHTFL